ncbi:MAG: hypothetical protein ACI9OJ_004680, partial [Myxococcota bacterium]
RTRPLTINAPSTVVVDARLCADGSTWVALGNLTGLGTGTPERFAPAAAIVEVTLAGASEAVVYTPDGRVKSNDIGGVISISVNATAVIHLV